jgi:hypothetical protein
MNAHFLNDKIRKFGKENNLKGFEASKPKGLNRIAKIGYGHLCLRRRTLVLITI